TCWRIPRRINRWWLVVVDGLDVGKTSRHRGNGTGRREDDVYGWRVSRLALDHSNDLRWCIVRFGDRNFVDGSTREERLADASSVWRLPGHRLNRSSLVRRPP